jgi:hypothetical protein
VPQPISEGDWMCSISRCCALACLLLGAAIPAPAAGQTVELLATDPPNGSLLYVGEALYVRLGYTGDEPLRFRVRGYLGGVERSTGTRTNPAPPYPAGAGEALAWIEYTAPIALDELRIEVYDAQWVARTQLVLPFDVGWRAGARMPLHSRAAWVAPMNAAQQQMTSTALASAHAGGDDDGWLLVFMLAGWSIPGYFVLQVVLYRRWRDGWRKAALLPLWGTVPIVAYTLFALLQGSNLWPLVMLFTVPLAFVYLVLLVLAKRVLAPA